MSGIALKFTALLVRTVAKPVAAKEHPTFRKMCISVAQRMHRTDIQLRMNLLGDKNVKVRPLNDTKAIENGANFLLESFIFSVAGGLILFEAMRARNKENGRREAVADDIATLQDEIEYIKKKLAQYNVKLDDYRPPAGMKYAVLRLDENGNTTEEYHQDRAAAIKAIGGGTSTTPTTRSTAEAETAPAALIPGETPMPLATSVPGAVDTSS